MDPPLRLFVNDRADFREGNLPESVLERHARRTAAAMLIAAIAPRTGCRFRTPSFDYGSRHKARLIRKETELIGNALKCTALVVTLLSVGAAFAAAAPAFSR
jgi:hypothetical protein